ncbi:flagellin [Blastococcus capsensis]|uniref:flagellin n=1 Tax=Blastococcus capsensis TaxID=1564163 RepID=UPI00254124D7|nr:flagellin [Blastococcus capsensis]MDK3255840.1 flagellin [Blastococcus capsensis]
MRPLFRQAGWRLRTAASSGLVSTGETPPRAPDRPSPTGNGSAGTYSATLDTGAAVRAIDGAISRVSAIRAGLGAIENRLEHTVARPDVSVENTTAAFSLIRDADVAAEMTLLTRNQVLVQAGTAMLAEADQAPRASCTC